MNNRRSKQWEYNMNKEMKSYKLEKMKDFKLDKFKMETESKLEKLIREGFLVKNNIFNAFFSKSERETGK